MVNHEIVNEYLKSAGWEFIVFVFLVYFRQEIKNVLKKISKIKAGPFEAEIESQLEGQKILQEQAGVTEDTEVGNLELFKEDDFIDEWLKQKELEYSHILDSKEQKNKKLIVEMALKQLELEFEKIYNSILGSQIVLLQDLQTHRSGVWHLWLENHFKKVVESYPEVFNNWELDKYLEFLIKNLLVKIEKPQPHAIITYYISKKGETFLTYIGKKGYPKNKLG